MCTVTVVPGRGTVRLACNRDELRWRPAALPPRVQQFGDRRAVLPVDPSAGGTWVAVNDAGLAMTLLNVNPEDITPATKEIIPARRASEGKPRWRFGRRAELSCRGNNGEEIILALRSRGTIIPALLHCSSLTSAISQATALEARPYAPFRLLLADHAQLAELRSEKGHVRLVCHTAITEPLFFTSSGLGDRLVEGPRRRLFAELFSRPGELVARQDRFHRHRWPERPHLSVCMRRAEARTVSHTVLSLAPGRVSLTYHPDAPDQPSETVSVTIPTAVGGVP